MVYGSEKERERKGGVGVGLILSALFTVGLVRGSVWQLLEGVELCSLVKSP